jgi:hypothetical protein
VSVAIAVIAVVRLPVNYLHEQDEEALRSWSLGRVLRNVVGALVVVVGIVLSVPGVPGQGILTILAGLLLMDVRAKRVLERRLLARPGMLRQVNRLRGRFGKPPLLPGRDDG